MKLERPAKRISRNAQLIESLMSFSTLIIMLGFFLPMVVNEFKANRILEFGILALMALAALDLRFPPKQREYENRFLYLLLATCLAGLIYLAIMSYL